VLYRARICPADLNNLIKALMYILERTPPVWGPYYPMVLKLQEVEVPVEYGRVPRPWRVLLRTWRDRSQITAEDWDDLLDITELLRLYWIPEESPYAKRNQPGDPLKEEEHRGATRIIAKILQFIGGPYPVWDYRPPPTQVAQPSGAGIGPLTLVFNELWSYGGMGNLGKIFREDWSYSAPPVYSLIFTETWSS
jgi:hypothetical protein